MAKDNRIDIEINAKGGPSLKKTTKQTKQQRKELDKLSGSGKKLDKQQSTQYTRQKQGVIQTANSTKNFSKMQQSMDGGGGAGGLVRTYALLAANVFALSAAFGILSRAAQVDSLTASMKQLEIVSGKAILQVSRDLQEAAGFGMDFAESMRATSLAMSAGFGGEEITQLASVARNAAVSLGRNVPDALDRIFRGVIKVEPELLDEIGLFVRVKEASAKYAAQIGKSASDLTEFEKRQAFMNEALEQGTVKFAAFEDIETDAFTLLGTTFSDITQGILSFLNKGILPLVRYLSENKLLFTTIFSIVAFTLIKMAIPAMGAFTSSIANNAATAAASHTKHMTAQRARIDLTNAEHAKWKAIQVEKREKLLALAAAETIAGPQAKLTGKNIKHHKRMEKALQKQVGQEKGMLQIKSRQHLIEKRIESLTTKKGVARANLSAAGKAELANLQAELLLHQQIGTVEATRAITATAKIAGHVSEITRLKLVKKEILSAGLATVVAAAETYGYGVAVKFAAAELEVMSRAATKAGITLSVMDKQLFMTKARLTAAGVAAQGFWMKLLGPFSIILLFLPLLQWFNKLLGVGSEEADKATKANKASAEALARLGPRIEHARKEWAKLNDETGSLTELQKVVAYNKGMEMFAETILTTVKNISTQEEAFEEYEKVASKWAFFWGEKFPAAFGGGTKNAIERGRKALIDGIKESGGDITPAMKAALDKIDTLKSAEGLKKAGSLQKQNELVIKAEKELITLAEKEATTFQTMRSAIDGAKDSAKEFIDSLIIKTDVDKPLSSFRQISSNLADATLTEKQRLNYAKEITENAAINAMMTQEERKALKDNVNNIEAFSEELEKVERRYFRQQQLIVRGKTELEAIAVIQKNITGLVKESTGAIELHYDNLKRIADINIQTAKITTQNARTQTGLTAERIAELATSDDILASLTEKESTEENIVLIQAAINAFRKEENLLIQETFDSATRELKVQKDILEMSLKRLTTQEKINNLQLEAFKLQQQIETFMRKGTIKLSPVEEMTAAIKTEEARLKTAQQRKTMELAIVDLKYRILEEEWKLLAEQKKQAKIEEYKHSERRKQEIGRAILLAQIQGAAVEAAFTKDDTKLKSLVATLKNVDAIWQENMIAGIKKISSESFINDTDMANMHTAWEAEKSIIEMTFDNLADKYIVTLLGRLEALKSKGGTDLVSPMQGTAMQSLDRMRGTRDFIGEAQSKQESLGGDITRLEEESYTVRPFTLEWIELTDKIKEATAAKEAWAKAEGAAEIQLFTNAIREFSAAVATLGGEGILAATMADFSAGLIETFTNVDEKLDTTADKLAVVAGIIQGIGAIMAAASAANIANIDKEIKAEQKRDGKSKQSLAKIKGMEAKKEQMAKKAFEVNKKIQIASAIMSTAAAIVGILAAESSKVGVFAVPLAAMVGALGMAQVAIISRMKYEGGTGAGDVSLPSAINVGERGSSVDVSKQASAGELAYLRGARGMGTSATAFTPTGGAAGWRSRGMAGGGEILVGERGPETITPLSPMQVWPSDMGAKSQINANFTIHAIDAQGVEDVLLAQQGNIIGMIRSAANDHGEEFLEAINTDMYGEPKSAGGVDY